MTNPSNFNEELLKARERIKLRINEAMTMILKEEIEKAMGRVKILVHSDLKGEWDWYIESEK